MSEISDGSLQRIEYDLAENRIMRKQIPGRQRKVQNLSLPQNLANCLHARVATPALFCPVLTTPDHSP